MATQFLFEGGQFIVINHQRKVYAKNYEITYDVPLALLLHNYGVSTFSIKKNSSQ